MKKINEEENKYPKLRTVQKLKLINIFLQQFKTPIMYWRGGKE